MSEGPSRTVGAKATVTLELFGLGTWGDDATMAQVRKQAGAEARDRIEHVFHQNKDYRGFKILDVKIEAVTAGEVNERA